jgi:hypothetical protein
MPVATEWTKSITEALIDSMANMYASGMSLSDISRQTSVPISTVRARLLARGVTLRSKREGTALTLPARSLKLRGRKRAPFSAEHREGIRNGRLAWGEVNARGVSLKPNGYMEITRGPHKGRSQHDVVMEQAIGRRLRPDEVVHHIDQNRSNNALENLQLMTRSAHTALHRRLRKEAA